MDRLAPSTLSLSIRTLVLGIRATMHGSWGPSASRSRPYSPVLKQPEDVAIGQLRLDPPRARKATFHRYDPVQPTTDAVTLLDEMDRDPTSIVWGQVFNLIPPRCIRRTAGVTRARRHDHLGPTMDRASWPARMWHVDTGCQDLTRLRLHQLADPVRTEPLRHDHEERPAVLAAQHARVAGAVELDPIE